MLPLPTAVWRGEYSSWKWSRKHELSLGRERGPRSTTSGVSRLLTTPSAGQVAEVGPICVGADFTLVMDAVLSSPPSDSVLTVYHLILLLFLPTQQLFSQKSRRPKPVHIQDAPCPTACGSLRVFHPAVQCQPPLSLYLRPSWGGEPPLPAGTGICQVPLSLNILVSCWSRCHREPVEGERHTVNGVLVVHCHAAGHRHGHRHLFSYLLLQNLQNVWPVRGRAVVFSLVICIIMYSCHCCWILLQGLNKI